MHGIFDRIAEREQRLADLAKKRQLVHDRPLIPGSRTTEFWVVIAALVPWAADKFGLDYDLIVSAAGEVAREVQPEADGNLPMAIAAVYVVGRIVLKYFRGR